MDYIPEETKMQVYFGMKTTIVDERYFKLAEKQLYSELAFALGVQKSGINQMIEKTLKLV